MRGRFLVKSPSLRGQEQGGRGVARTCVAGTGGETLYAKKVPRDLIGIRKVRHFWRCINFMGKPRRESRRETRRFFILSGFSIFKRIFYEDKVSGKANRSPFEI